MTEIRCRSGGGLALVDHGILAKWKATPPFDETDFAELLSIAVDTSGKTEQVNRWADEEWSEVWQRETMRLVDLANAGEIAAVVFRCGVYHCDFSVLSQYPKSTSSLTLTQWLYVPTGVVVISEMGQLAEDWEVKFPVDHESFAQMEVTVAKGWNKVSFVFPPDIEVQGQGRRRIYGSPQFPACLVRCEEAREQHYSIESLPIYPPISSY